MNEDITNISKPYEENTPESLADLSNGSIYEIKNVIVYNYDEITNQLLTIGDRKNNEIVFNGTTQFTIQQRSSNGNIVDPINILYSKLNLSCTINF